MAVEGVGGCAAHDGAVAFVEFEADGASDGLLSLCDEGIEGGFEGGEPQALVGEFGVALFDGRLEAEDVSGEGQGFEFAVGGDDCEGCGCFVDLAALYPDQPVLDHVDAADAVCAGDGASSEMRSTSGSSSPSRVVGSPSWKPISTYSGLSGAFRVRW